MKIKLILLIIFVMLISSCLNYNKKNEEINKMYIEVKRDTSFYGIVDSLFLFTAYYNGTICIRLSNGLKFQTTGSAPVRERDLNNPSQYFFYDFLIVGDTVMKKKGEDIIYILKNNRSYSYFLATKEYSDSIFHRPKSK